MHIERTAKLDEVHLSPESLERFIPLAGEDTVRAAIKTANATRARLGDSTLWNINSTAVGGGVAEMLLSLLPYVRGVGINARWLVIHGSLDFFRLTKQLHNSLHGEPGDGLPLDDAARELYENTMRSNCAELIALVRPGDFVVLHDPQTAGLAGELIRTGANVIWRCHIGRDTPNEETARGWGFLDPYLRDVPLCVFSRRAYIPSGISPDRCAVIQPSIDPFGPKNQDMDRPTTLAILAHVGLIDGSGCEGRRAFRRSDGSPGRVDLSADVVSLGPAPRVDTPLIVQVSRWDTLKDPLGVLHGFALAASNGLPMAADLVLAGPSVHAVADDPDGARVFDEVLSAWRELPHAVRRRVHLANLPMHDVEENAAIVNALQRHAAIIVQKSLREGFGLTVTEAMWKERPVVASAVGGIQDQIVDGQHGVLVSQPRDLDEFRRALHRVLDDPVFAQTIARNARERVREYYLGLRHLLDYAASIARIDARLSAGQGTGAVSSG